MRLTADHILFPDADAPAPGFLEIEGERIVAASRGNAPWVADEHLSGTVVPGYVDVHVHGGGGASFVTEDPAVAWLANNYLMPLVKGTFKSAPRVVQETLHG